VIGGGGGTREKEDQTKNPKQQVLVHICVSSIYCTISTISIFKLAKVHQICND
jgi:hypothetical protein